MVSEEAKKEAERFFDNVNPKSDGLSLLLRTHLFLEFQLEQLIRSLLPRADFLLGRKGKSNANLKFTTKLAIVRSFNVIEEDVLMAVERVNWLRNQCAHNLTRTITKDDIRLIGGNFEGQIPGLLKPRGDIENSLYLVLVFVSMALAGNRLGYEDRRKE